jgi:hypothetical protein
MKASKDNLLKFINNSNQFSIIIYSWIKNEWERLWDNIMNNDY